MSTPPARPATSTHPDTTPGDVPGDAPSAVHAQVWLGDDRFEERTWPAPALGPGEALAAVDLATVCGSDLHTVTGRRPGPHPSVLGHEGIGHIVALGDEPPFVVTLAAPGTPTAAVDIADDTRESDTPAAGSRRAETGDGETRGGETRGGETPACETGSPAGRVGEADAHRPADASAFRTRPARIGDRVVWGVTVGCGRCTRCRAGRTAKCLHLRKTGHEPVDGPWPLSGGYATHLHVPAGLPLVVVPEQVPDGPAAMSACALATVMACVEAAGDLAGRRVLVVGAGMLGLCAVAVARSLGATVHVADPDPARAAQAVALGAVRRDEDEDADLVDVVIELSGAIPGVEAGFAALDVGGRLVLAGSVAPRGNVALDPEHLVRGHLSIVGVHNYEPRHLTQAVAFLAGPGAHVDWSAYIAPPVPLAQTAAAVLHPGDWLRRSVAPGAAGRGLDPARLPLV